MVINYIIIVLLNFQLTFYLIWFQRLCGLICLKYSYYQILSMLQYMHFNRDINISLQMEKTLRDTTISCFGVLKLIFVLLTLFYLIIQCERKHNIL